MPSFCRLSKIFLLNTFYDMYVLFEVLATLVKTNYDMVAFVLKVRNLIFVHKVKDFKWSLPLSKIRQVWKKAKVRCLSSLSAKLCDYNILVKFVEGEVYHFSRFRSYSLIRISQLECGANLLFQGNNLYWDSLETRSFQTTKCHSQILSENQCWYWIQEFCVSAGIYVYILLDFYTLRQWPL